MSDRFQDFQDIAIRDGRIQHEIQWGLENCRRRTLTLERIEILQPDFDVSRDHGLFGIHSSCTSIDAGENAE